MFPVKLPVHLGILYFKMYQEIPRVHIRKQGGVRMDLSPRCKMIIMLMYFRFLPGITVCRLFVWEGGKKNAGYAVLIKEK